VRRVFSGFIIGSKDRVHAGLITPTLFFEPFHHIRIKANRQTFLSLIGPEIIALSIHEGWTVNASGSFLIAALIFLSVSLEIRPQSVLSSLSPSPKRFLIIFSFIVPRSPCTDQPPSVTTPDKYDCYYPFAKNRSSPCSA